MQQHSIQHHAHHIYPGEPLVLSSHATMCLMNNSLTVTWNTTALFTVNESLPWVCSHQL